jgi:UDP-glucose 4-epimerase
MNYDFWKNKKVALCGGASFIASHVIEALTPMGADIRVVDDLSSGKLSNLTSVGVNKVQIGDLRYYQLALDATKGADIVLDFSSVHGGRGFVGTNHDVAISDNFIINSNVVKAAAENGVDRIAFCSSGCIYDTRRQMNDREDFKIPETWDMHESGMYPDGMYGLTKAAHERTLMAYHRDGKIKTAICRFFTVFGPRMKENHFILASIAKTFIKTDPYYVWGNGNEVRNFTPVQNTVQGFLLATEQANGCIYNVGLEQRITINYALERIWALMGWRPKEVIYQPDKPVGIRNRVADCSKIRKELGWNPEVSFDEGLNQTIDWYVSTHSKMDVQEHLEGLLTSR